MKNDDLRHDDLFRYTGWLLIAKTLRNANYAPFIKEMNRDEQLKSFLESNLYVYNRGVDSIIIYAGDYVNKK